MSNYLVADTDLTSVANAIRTKAGLSGSLEFPNDFISAVEGISNEGYTSDEIAYGNISGAITITGNGNVRPYAFHECSGITSATGESVTILPDRVFSNCDNLTSINFPNCVEIGSYTFYYCESLTSITLPTNKNVKVGSSAFYGCQAFSGIDFSGVYSIGTSAFRDCLVTNCLFDPITVMDSGLRDVEYLGIEYWERLSSTSGTYSFAGAYDSSNHCTVSYFVAPVLSTIGGANSLANNNCLIGIDFKKLSSIPKQTFQNNTAFNKLILRKSSVTSLANIDAFTNTPFASDGSGGTLYVPQSLISSYQAASNWSTILAYSNNSIVAIEGSYYETHYADGTSIS